MKRFLMIVLVAAATAFAIWFGTRGTLLTSKSSATVTALLPKETLAFVHVPDLNRSREQWHETDLYKLWSEPALQEFLQKPLAKFPRAGSAREKTQELAALGMRDAFIALTAWDNNQPKITAGFRFKGSADDAEKVIGQWRARAAVKAPGAAPATVDYQQHPIQLVTSEHVTVATAYDGDWFLAANDLTLLKTLLDRLDGRQQDGASTLAADESYLAAAKHIPAGYAAFVYARLGEYLKRLAERAPDPSHSAQLGMLRQVRDMAAATSFDNGKLRDVLFVATPKIEGAGELTRGSLNLATADSFLYAAGLFRLPDQLSSAPAAAAPPSGLPIPLQHAASLLAASGITSEEFSNAFASEPSLIGDWPAGMRIPGLLLSLPVKDSAKANQIVAAATAGDAARPWVQSAKDGVQYYTLPPANPMVPLTPTIAVGSELLVAGLDPASVEAAIKRAGSETSALAASQTFKSAEALVPKPSGSFTYIDTALLYSRLDTALRPMLVMSAAFLPGIADTIDLGKLPATDVITRHLSPIVMSQTYREDGYVMESVGPLSFFQAIGGLAAASGAGAAFYQHQVHGAYGSGSSTVNSATTDPSPPGDGDDE